jgi:hypothetical protein
LRSEGVVADVSKEGGGGGALRNYFEAFSKTKVCRRRVRCIAKMWKVEVWLNVEFGVRGIGMCWSEAGAALYQGQ